MLTQGSHEADPRSGRTILVILPSMGPEDLGMLLLRVSQVGPPKLAGHWQLKLLTPCVQVPPF